MERIESSLRDIKASVKNIELELAKREKALASLADIEARPNNWEYTAFCCAWAVLGIVVGAIIVLIAPFP